MDELQFEEFILKPSLEVIGLWSPSAHILLLGTFLIESDLKFFEQKGPGTAMGIGQVEDKTYDDILRYLNRYDKQNLKESVLSACFYLSFPPRSALMHNLRWAVIVTRLKYLPARPPLPAWNDAQGMTQYHKVYYNGPGKTNVTESVKIFERIISQRRNKFEG